MPGKHQNDGDDDDDDDDDSPMQTACSNLPARTRLLEPS